jgi:hypothetical protein
MSMAWWPDESTKVDLGLAVVEPVEVLYELEEPRLFVTGRGRDMKLWYLMDIDPDKSRYLVAGINRDVLSQLRCGTLPVRDALTRSGAWLVDVDNDDAVMGSWRVDIARLPEGALPQEGVTLPPDRSSEPILAASSRP